MRKDNAIIRRRNYGHFNTFNTTEVRHPKSDTLEAKKRQASPTDVQFFNPPALAAGFTLLDFDRSRNVRVEAVADNVSQNSADLHIKAWYDTKLYNAACTWFHVAADDRDIQTGQFSTLDDHVWHKPQTRTSRRITFDHAYAKPPRVIVWLNLLDTIKGKNCRVSAKANEITKDGFTIHLDTWEDSVLYRARASWIAHPCDMPGILSGTFDISDIRPWNEPQRYNSGRVSFPNGAFRGTPTVLVGLNGLDVDKDHNLRVKLSSDSACEHGFTWHIDAWADTILYNSGASFIAFDT